MPCDIAFISGPARSERVPTFEALKVESALAGQ